MRALRVHREVKVHTSNSIWAKSDDRFELISSASGACVLKAERAWATAGSRKEPRWEEEHPQSPQGREAAEVKQGESVGEVRLLTLKRLGPKYRGLHFSGEVCVPFASHSRQGSNMRKLFQEGELSRSMWDGEEGETAGGTLLRSSGPGSEEVSVAQAGETGVRGRLVVGESFGLTVDSSLSEV